ncbi:MAG: acetyl-coenzyme A synthetase N-terminal domain-containing protein, partial [Planctomycetota bacterium]
MESIYPPPSQFAANAHVKSPDEYREIYAQSVADPEKFWAGIAERLTWRRRWD